MKFYQYKIGIEDDGRSYVLIPDPVVLLRAKGLLVALLHKGLIKRTTLLGRQVSKLVRPKP